MVTVHNCNNYYMRFGELPPDGRSKIFYNFEFVIEELDGISCWECIKTPDGKYQLVLPYPLTRAGISDVHNMVYDSKPDDTVYILQGDVVGTGPVNEPLLSNATIVEEIKISDIVTNMVTDYFTEENLEGCGGEYDNYWIKLNSGWTKASKRYYEKFTGTKAIITEEEQDAIKHPPKTAGCDVSRVYRKPPKTTMDQYIEILERRAKENGYN